MYPVVIARVSRPAVPRVGQRGDTPQRRRRQRVRANPTSEALPIRTPAGRRRIDAVVASGPRSLSPGEMEDGAEAGGDTLDFATREEVSPTPEGHTSKRAISDQSRAVPQA